MAIGAKPARADARERAERIRRREAAVQARRADRILNRRATGEKIERIAGALGLSEQDVRETLARYRKGRDPRALTDKQCAALARPKAETQTDEAREAAEIQATLDAAVAAAAMPVRADAPEASGAVAYANLQERLAKAGRLREAAERFRIKQPAGAAGLLHLADLYEHHATGYPEHAIKSEGVTLQRYVPQLLHSPGGSPALACLGA